MFRSLVDPLALPQGPLRSASLLLVALAFVGAGVNHFVRPDIYLAIMPPYLPAHGFLVALSGGIEVAGGIAVLVPRLREKAGWMLVLLLVAVFPANVHMALHPTSFAELPAWVLWARLPVQVVLIGWVRWSTRPDHRADG